MIADATTCTASTASCIGRAGFDALMIGALCLFVAVLIVIVASVLWKRMGGGQPKPPIHTIVEFREDPTTRQLNRSETALNMQRYLGQADDLGDPFGILENPTPRQRLNGGQRYLGRGER